MSTQTLKPWARGPFELVRHAEGHLKAGTDFDKRMALISFDNAIEVAITTHLRLHPAQRAGKTYRLEEIDRWLANYHSKLEFLFEVYAKTLVVPLSVTVDEIIWYHSLRNDLYHAGNGLVPEEHSLTGARASALCVFSALFEVNAERILEETVPTIQPVSSNKAALPAQMLFLQSFIRLERTLASTLEIMGATGIPVRKPLNLVKYWALFASKGPGRRADYEKIIGQALPVRNAYVHGLAADVPEDHLLKLADKLDEISQYVGSYAFSFDILGALEKRYPQWLRPDITAARIIQREGMVFLEIVARKGSGPDEDVSRKELGFIWGDHDKPMFSPTRTAFENAELLLNKLDPYDIINCTDLFTREGAEQVAKIYGPPKKP